MIRAPFPLAVSPSATSSAPRPSDAKENPALDRACKEFEAVFLRQLLEVSKVGKQAGSGYGSMIVDALATSVNDAGGLGLAERIRQSLESHPSTESQR